MSGAYDNTNKGVLFRNDKEGGNANWPDYRGNINIDGKEFWLDAWIKEPRDANKKKFMSLSVKPKLLSDRSSPPTGGKNDHRRHPANPPVDDGGFDSDIPF